MTDQGTFRSIAIGFLGSLFCTLIAYFIVVAHLFSAWFVNGAIALLALGQAWLQLALLFQLGKESNPRWNLIVFLFMVMVTCILVIGSLWIMHHLDYNLMSDMH